MEKALVEEMPRVKRIGVANFIFILLLLIICLCRLLLI